MKKIGNILWGVVLIIIGLIIGGNALGITHINIFFNGWWTLFIIIPCFIGLFRENEKTGSLIGLLIGVILLLGCQNLLDFDLILKLALPVILVVIGISIIFKDISGKKVSNEIKQLNQKGNGGNSYCAAFSGQSINFDGENIPDDDVNKGDDNKDDNITADILDRTIHGSVIKIWVDGETKYVFVKNQIIKEGDWILVNGKHYQAQLPK